MARLLIRESKRLERNGEDFGNSFLDTERAGDADSTLTTAAAALDVDIDFIVSALNSKADIPLVSVLGLLGGQVLNRLIHRPQYVDLCKLKQWRIGEKDRRAMLMKMKLNDPLLDECNIPSCLVCSPA